MKLKIQVAHFGRQYCNEMLIALQKAGWLEQFYTALAANLIPRRFWPSALKGHLRKRVFVDVPAHQITHYPVLFLLERTIRRYSAHWSMKVGDCFDFIVSRKIRKAPCHIFISYENTNLASMQAAKQSGKVTILDLAQIHQNDILERGRWFMSSERLRWEEQVVNPRKQQALDHTDYVITLSEFAASSMLKNGWSADRLFTVNLGIDPLQFALKSNYNQTGPLSLLFVGTITRRKGLEVLLNGIKELTGQPVELTLIGPMADGQDLLEQFSGMFTYIPFLHHEALVGYLQAADVFVFPSLLDSWAQTVIEAMACGTPAIVTDHTGAKDAVLQGGGWVIPAGDKTALKNCILHCLENRLEVEKTGRQAHQIAQQYTWANYHKQLEGLIKEIAQREQIVH